jgi:hypothetical protein
MRQAAALLVIPAVLFQTPVVAIRLGQTADGKKATFDVSGLSPTALAGLADGKLSRTEWAALFGVYVATEGAAKTDNPPILGSYRVEEKVLRFEPEFPVVPGVRYRAVFDPMKLPGQRAAKRQVVIEEFAIPRPVSQPTTVVEQVYPSGDTLPENQLRFYIHFSAPMRQGDVYRHIRLLDSGRKPVDQALLELEDELWDRDGKRFTLFFHPGRVKKGLQPREELGPILVEGKSYTLEIDRQWLDAKGNPLKASFGKRFKAGPAEEDRPDPKTWKIQTPGTGTTAPLTVRFPRPLDHSLLHRLLWITDPQGRKIAGRIDVTETETVWRFTPDRNWESGKYDLVADTRLEDRAGNSIARPFEVDVLHPLENEIKTETVRLPFQAR